MLDIPIRGERKWLSNRVIGFGFTLGRIGLLPKGILPKKEGIIDYPRGKSLAWVGSIWMDQSLEQGVRYFKKNLTRD